MKRKLYITLLGLLSTIITAAVPYCDVRKFSITDGLAANTISDLKQGKDNLMWFSTWNGEFCIKDKQLSDQYTTFDEWNKIYNSERVLTLDELPNLKCYPMDTEKYLEEHK